MNNATAARIRTSLQAALNAELNRISECFSANEVHLMSVALSGAAGDRLICRMMASNHKTLNRYATSGGDICGKQ